MKRIMRRIAYFLAILFGLAIGSAAFLFGIGYYIAYLK